MNLESQVARLDTLEALIELLSAEYNGILEEVSEEWDFITSEEESAREQIERKVGMPYEAYLWLLDK